MTLVSIVIALVLEQFHALSVRRVVRSPLARMAAFLEDKFNDGGRAHGAIAWWLGAALLVAVVSLAHALLMRYQPLLAFLLGIGVLYLTMGFCQFSHFFTEIHLVLRLGEVEQARQLLTQWRGGSGDRLTGSEVARLAIEQALLSSHRHVLLRCCGSSCWVRRGHYSTASRKRLTNSGESAGEGSLASSAASRTRPLPWLTGCHCA